MMIRARWLGFALLVVGLTGCTTNTITNLTPATATRSPDGLYRLEAQWNSNQRTVRDETLTPFVIVGTDAYAMERTPLVDNRWEAIVPVPDDQRFFNYHYKFNYEYAAMPVRRRDSKLSRDYQLEIID